MKKIAITLLTFLMFSGCASTNYLQGYVDLKGYPLDSAVSKMGIPDQEQNMMDVKVYSWFGKEITKVDRNFFGPDDYETFFDCVVKVIVSNGIISQVEINSEEIETCPGYSN